MKRRTLWTGLLWILLLVQCMSLFPAHATHICPAGEMVDVVAGAWYHDAVDYALENKLMSGYNATTFGPNDNLSRAMVVQVLYNKEGQPAVTEGHTFPDVGATDWFNNAVSWASGNNVVGGYGDGRFGPNDSVTLEEIVVILWNYLGNPVPTGNAAVAGEHSDWAANALGWAVGNNILAHIAYRPVSAKATRAQTAQLLKNYLSLNQSAPAQTGRPLEGKTIVNFGDSIFGNYRAPTDISTFLAQKTGATVYNVGFGGSRMSRDKGERDALSMYRLADAVATGDWSLQDKAMSTVSEWSKLKYFPDTVELLKSIDFNKVDIVTIALGTNDFTAKCPAYDPADLRGTHSFAGALTHTIETLSAAYPHLDIVICTPTWRCWLNDYLQVTDTAESRVLGGQKLTDIVQAARDITQKYGLLCIDNYSNSGLSMENLDICFAGQDGTHPTEAGRKMIADNMAKELIKHYGG